MTGGQAEYLEVEGEGHRIEISPSAVLSSTIKVRGTANTLRIGPGVRFAPESGAMMIAGEGHCVSIAENTTANLYVTVKGSGGVIEIGETCHLTGAVNLMGRGARLGIGRGTTMVDGRLQLHEPGEIEIGEDCMISSQVYISISDIHPIYDRTTGARINPARSIVVGRHVWLGLRSMILKGAHIGNGTIIAAGAMISGETPAHAVVTGPPMRVMRNDIVWSRDFGDTPPVIE